MMDVPQTRARRAGPRQKKDIQSILSKIRRFGIKQQKLHRERVSYLMMDVPQGLAAFFTWQPFRQLFRSLYFLKAPFCPQKGTFKGQKQAVFSPFCNHIKELLRSDPQRIGYILKHRRTTYLMMNWSMLDVHVYNCVPHYTIHCGALKIIPICWHFSVDKE